MIRKPRFWKEHVSLPEYPQLMMMSSPAKIADTECPDCGKSFKDSYAVTRHVQSGRCQSVKKSAPRRRSGRSGEPEPEPDPTILQQDLELEELLSSSPCPFAQYVSQYLIIDLYPINCLPSDTESVKSWRLSPSSAICCFFLSYFSGSILRLISN